MQLVDTHCHIHSTDYPLDKGEVIQRALEAGVGQMICVGTDQEDSAASVRFVQDQPHCWASIGLHPHDAKTGVDAVDALARLIDQPKVVAVGECGLDYFYNHSPRDMQAQLLHAQIELAVGHDLPLIFHVREAFDDFWPIFDGYQGLRGVLHSFTDSQANLEKALARGLYIGVNGIATFTKDAEQTAMFRAIPIEKLLLETDAPFLTPAPKRGTVNEPAFVSLVAEYMAHLHAISPQELSAATSRNATYLFRLT